MAQQVYGDMMAHWNQRRGPRVGEVFNYKSCAATLFIADILTGLPTCTTTFPSGGWQAATSKPSRELRPQNHTVGPVARNSLLQLAVLIRSGSLAY